MISATIDGVRDNWDYYCFQADDSGWSLGEIIEITLTNIPPNNDYDLYLYRSIADCQSDNQMQSSANGANQDETIFWRESITSPQDDSGIYVIGVKRYGQTSYSCDLEYSLRVTGLR